MHCAIGLVVELLLPGTPCSTVCTTQGCSCGTAIRIHCFPVAKALLRGRKTTSRSPFVSKFCVQRKAACGDVRLAWPESLCVSKCLAFACLLC